MSTEVNDHGGIERFNGICRVVFVLAALACAGFVVVLQAELTYLWPLGGNDEPMHLSMAGYIAEHLAWPAWDSPDIERFFAISYATSPSLNYWFDGLLIRLTGYDRTSQFLLFCVCLAVFAGAASRNPLAGLLALALTVPQVVFVFSYLNTDAWSATVALLLGVALDRFVADPTRTRNIVAFFCAAAACLTCRYHMWAIGCVAFALPLLPRLRMLWTRNPRGLLIATIAGTAIASWWPTTSYFANDGDPIGFRAARQEQLQFARPNGPELKMAVSNFDPLDFFERMGKSFYGWWGWATIALPHIYYKAALLIAAPLLLFALAMHRNRLGLVLLLFEVNVALMLWRAITYHHVLWQGRYLFPAFFVTIGILVHREAVSQRLRKTPKMAWFMAAWCTVVIGLNLWATAELYAKTQRAEARAAANPPHLRGQMMLHSGKTEWARKLFQQAVEADPEDFRSHNALGFLAMHNGDFETARLHLTRAKALEPTEAQILLNLGIVLLSDGKADEAVREFREAIKHNPRSAVLHYYLSTAYEAQRDLGNALRSCRRALQLAPGDTAAEEQLKALLGQMAASAPVK